MYFNDSLSLNNILVIDVLVHLLLTLSYKKSIKGVIRHDVFYGDN